MFAYLILNIQTIFKVVLALLGIKLFFFSFLRQQGMLNTKGIVDLFLFFLQK